VALGTLVDEFERSTARSLGADQFNITPSPNVAPELVQAGVSGFETLLRTTQIEYGKYFNRQLFVGLQATPLFFQATPAIPGFRVQYRFARQPGLSIESAWQPRFFPGVPTLGDPNLLQRNAFGAFLVRQWRF